MNGKIFIHIGLPKTATTTLQIDFFPSLCGEHIHYLGILQPRSKKQSDIYKKISMAVNTGLLINEARTELIRLLDSSQISILSEESFTVSDKNSSWRVKLKNLSEILCELDYTILISVREPTAAMFSYYVELYDQFSTEDKCFLDLAKNDDRMHIYHYGKFTDVVWECFERDRVFVKKFEEIVDGNLSDWTQLITSGESNDDSIKINNHNAKINVGQKVYTGKNISLADAIKRVLIALGWFGEGRGVRLKRLLAPVVRFMERISFYSEVAIARPSQADMAELKKYLGEETSALDKYFGIKYE